MCRRGNTLKCIHQVYLTHGFSGFYKGITASYYGISETIVHFVIYEAIKAELMKPSEDSEDTREAMDFLKFMMAGATSKTIATCLAYPHGRLQRNCYKVYMLTHLT